MARLIVLLVFAGGVLVPAAGVAQGADPPLVGSLRGAWQGVVTPRPFSGDASRTLVVESVRRLGGEWAVEAVWTPGNTSPYAVKGTAKFRDGKVFVHFTLPYIMGAHISGALELEGSTDGILTGVVRTSSGLESLALRRTGAGAPPAEPALVRALPGTWTGDLVPMTTGSSPARTLIIDSLRREGGAWAFGGIWIIADGERRQIQGVARVRDGKLAVEIKTHAQNPPLELEGTTENVLTGFARTSTQLASIVLRKAASPAAAAAPPQAAPPAPPAPAPSVASAPPSAPTPAEPVRQSVGAGEHLAVVIGIGNYDVRTIPQLKFATADAEAVYRVLTTEGAFKKENVLLLTDNTSPRPTLRAIKSALGTFLARRARPQDTVVMFFAGHGAPEIDLRGIERDGVAKYLIPADADPNDLYATALSMDEMHTIFGRIEAERVVMFLDACYSGAAGGRTFASTRAGTRSLSVDELFLDRLAGAKGRLLITASRASEVSIELPELGHGVFSYYLVEGLKGAADRDRDGIVTLHELYDYIGPRVSQRSRAVGGNQHPVLKGEMEGVLPLVKVRR